MLHYKEFQASVGVKNEIFFGGDLLQTHWKVLQHSPSPLAVFWQPPPKFISCISPSAPVGMLVHISTVYLSECEELPQWLG